MSLFGKLWNRLRGTPKVKTRARRLFLEPLEGRQLLAVDLAVTKFGPDVIAAGESNGLEWTITVTNNGDETATNITLSDVTPALTQFVAFTPDVIPATSLVIDIDPADPNSTGTPSTATVNQLLPNEFFSFTLEVFPDRDAPEDSVIVNDTAQATSDADEISAGTFDNNTAPATMTTVFTSADLQMESIVDNPDPVSSIPTGQNLTYTITVTNGGDSDAVNPLFEMLVPTNTTFVSLTPLPPGWTEDPGNPAPGGTGIVRASAATLLANTSVQFTLTVKVNDNTPDGTIILANATVSSAEADDDPDPTNNTLAQPVQTEVEGPAQPMVNLSITKTDGLTEAIPGQTITYTITVANAGPDAVTDATVTDMFPSDLTNITYTASSSNGATGFTPSGSGNINDTLVDLPNGSSVIYIVTATILPSALAPLINTATVDPPAGTLDTDLNNNSATDTDTLTPRADLTVIKTDSPDPVTAGTDLTYTITVTNQGPSEAQAVELTDMVPTGTTFVSFTPPSVDWTPFTPPPGGTGTVGAIVSRLAPMSPSVFVLVVNVNPDTLPGPAAITNTASVTSATEDPTPGSTSDTETTTVNAVADLAITKDDGQTTIEAGQTLTYTIVVSNLGGPSTVTGATVEDIFDPAKYSSVSYTSVATNGATGNSGDTSPINGNITDVVTLPPNSTITYTVTAVVSSSFSGTLTNTAQVTSPAGVTDAPGNNIDSDDTTVTPPPFANLSVVKTDSPDPVFAGSNITYTITVSNAGAVNATGVVLTDAVPSGTTLVSFNLPTGWTRTDPTPVPAGGTGTLRANKTTPLAPGAANQGVFTLVVRVNPNAPNGSTITNTAAATTTTVDEIDPANNSDTETTAVQTQANLNVTKTDSPDPVAAGGNLTYTITVSTTGPSDAQTVQLTDVVPAGTTFVSFAAPAGWTTNTPSVGASGTVTATRPTLAANAAAATFTLVVRVGSAVTDGTLITNTATLTSITNDPSPNTATTTSTVQVAQDFGDAPATYDAGAPARHITSTSLRMGATVDSESAAQNNATATGDDALGQDDEDGVTVPGTVLINRDAAVIVNASSAGRLDAWIDFNRNGVFDEPSERIATSILLVAGPNTIPFVVPANAVEGPSFARFRLSAAGGLGPTGPASDGEVEDYAVGIDAVDPGSIGVIPDPENPGFNMLSINGTAGNDSISVKQLRSHKLLVEVTMNRKRMGTFSMADFRRVVVNAGAGNDSVQIGPALSSSLRGEEGNDVLTGAGGFDNLFGGPGNDRLNGNGGNDRLFGEDGNDSLNGGNGNDLMLGGAGRDTLSGGKHNDVMIGGLGVDSLRGDQGDDIVIGGTTDHDENRVALDQIMAIWGNSKDSFSTRIGKLSPLLNGTTVNDDGSRDRLEGGTQRDWYLDYLLADTIVGFNRSQDRKN